MHALHMLYGYSCSGLAIAACSLRKYLVTEKTRPSLRTVTTSDTVSYADVVLSSPLASCYSLTCVPHSCSLQRHLAVPTTFMEVVS